MRGRERTRVVWHRCRRAAMEEEHPPKRPTTKGRSPTTPAHEKDRAGVLDGPTAHSAGREAGERANAIDPKAELLDRRCHQGPRSRHLPTIRTRECRAGKKFPGNFGCFFRRRLTRAALRRSLELRSRNWTSRNWTGTFAGAGGHSPYRRRDFGQARRRDFGQALIESGQACGPRDRNWTGIKVPRPSDDEHLAIVDRHSSPLDRHFAPLPQPSGDAILDRH